MNKMLITNIDNRRIYLINDDKISFYINMPEATTTRIAINLLDKTDKINIDINNNERIKEEITNIYSTYHYNDISIITPVLDTNILEQLKLNNNEKIFIYTDKYISYLINQAYSLLTAEEITVNNIIKLNNNKTYKDFNEWFIKKYDGRVELVDYNKSSFDNFFSNDSVNKEINQDKSLANKVLDNTNSMDVIEDEYIPNETGERDLGFVSYVLLGVVVAVISLVILYKLL